MQLDKLSARALLAEIEKRAKRRAAAVDAMIAAGHGSTRGSDIRELAKGSSLLSITALAREWLDAGDSVQAAYAEQDARRRYHGTDKPIKR